jgi:hypothetical protein
MSQFRNTSGLQVRKQISSTLRSGVHHIGTHGEATLKPRARENSPHGDATKFPFGLNAGARAKSLRAMLPDHGRYGQSLVLLCCRFILTNFPHRTLRIGIASTYCGITESSEALGANQVTAPVIIPAIHYALCHLLTPQFTTGPDTGGQSLRLTGQFTRVGIMLRKKFLKTGGPCCRRLLLSIRERGCTSRAVENARHTGKGRNFLRPLNLQS